MKCSIKLHVIAEKDKVDRTKELAKTLTHLERVKEAVWSASPGGVHKEWREYHRFGDYFESIEVSDIDGQSFQMDFQVRDEAKSYWKDLLINVMTDLEKVLGANVRIFRK